MATTEYRGHPDLVRLPPPSDPRAPVPVLVAELAERLGVRELASTCCDLLGGAPRERHLAALRYLSGHDWAPGSQVRDPEVWHDHWPRTCGARGLLHVWHDDATACVLGGLGDEHWRPVEMCLKVCTRHGVAGAGAPVAALAGREERRVRAQVARALGVVRDVEHIEVLNALGADADAGVRQAAERTWEQAGRRLDLVDRPSG